MTRSFVIVRDSSDALVVSSSHLLSELSCDSSPSPENVSFDAATNIDPDDSTFAPLVGALRAQTATLTTQKGPTSYRICNCVDAHLTNLPKKHFQKVPERSKNNLETITKGPQKDHETASIRHKTKMTSEPSQNDSKLNLERFQNHPSWRRSRK